MAEAYPLEWPDGFPRTDPEDRERARFGKQDRQGIGRDRLTVADAVQRLRSELSRLGVDSGTTVISTNFRPRNDGLPYSNQKEPADPGVAVYFHLDGQPHCLPCDRWTRVADNLAAVAAHINATRAIERYGVGDVARVFAGFRALPDPESAGGQDWRSALGLGPDATPAEGERAGRELAHKYHPDRPSGGDRRIYQHVQEARRQARQEKEKA